MTETQRDEIHRLWDSIADFPVSAMDAALCHLMEGIARMMGAGNAYWLGYIRLAGPAAGDPLKGLRPCANRYLYPAPIHNEAYRATIATAIAEAVDLYRRALTAKTAGKKP